MNNRIFILIAAMFLLPACAQVMPVQPDDPYYAPAIPAMPYTENSQPKSGSIFSQQTASFLYSDRTASRIGDLITVNLNESTNASKNADTEIKKKNADSTAPVISGRVPSYGGNPISFALDSSRQ